VSVPFFLHRPAIWFTAFAIWFGVLWWLSSGVPDVPAPLQFRASDKLLHFGWFGIGAGLISGFLFLRWPARAARGQVLLATVVVALTGALDEFHQSFIPGRSGNDPFDFAADVLGALAGSLAFVALRRFLPAPRPAA
jgi:VanZ family protein